MIKEGHSDYIKQKKQTERTVVVGVGMILTTVFVTMLPVQSSYAQNASAPTAGARTVTNQGHQVTITTTGNATTTATTHQNQLTITTVANTSRTVAVPSNFTTNLSIGNKIYPLIYRITGGDNKLNSVSLKKDSSTLLLNISSPSQGTLTIELPRNIIDSKRQGTNHDENYVVFEDGQNTPVTQIKNNTQLRTLAIDFDKDTSQLEIAGTHAVPEFMTVVPATIFALAIIGIIVASTKYKGRASIMQKR